MLSKKQNLGRAWATQDLGKMRNLAGRFGGVRTQRTGLPLGTGIGIGRVQFG